MRRKIGPLEIGIFGTSLLVLGLIIWFFTMTFFGSRNNSEAQALLVLGPASAPSGRSPGKGEVSPTRAEDLALGGQAPVAAPQVSRPVPQKMPQPVQKKEQPVAQSEPVKVPEQTTEQTVIPETPSVQDQAKPPEVPVPPVPELEATLEEAKTSQEAEIIEFKPTSLRDPTLSPDDLKAIARRKRELELKTQQAQQTKVIQKRVMDPFEAVKRKIEVQGVLNMEEGILAIINNQILKKGDEIFGARILQILGNRVVLKYQNKIFEKRVKQ